MPTLIMRKSHFCTGFYMPCLQLIFLIRFIDMIVEDGMGITGFLMRPCWR